MVNVKQKRCEYNAHDKYNCRFKIQRLLCRLFHAWISKQKNHQELQSKRKRSSDFCTRKILVMYCCLRQKNWSSCSAQRPYAKIDLGYQVIIVEVDENQHQTYDCSYENKRLIQLSQDIGHQKMVFICFNPDEYIENGVKINSCFSRTKLGFLVIPKSKQAEWENRLNVLHDTIKYWMEYKTNKTVEIVHLFYDGMWKNVCEQKCDCITVVTVIFML